MGADHAKPPRPSLTDAASVYLDAWRAVASNLVVVSHVLLLYFPGQFNYKGGSFAVAVFFLLSGFLISQSMLKAASRPGPQFAGFLADRVARIMTPFVPVLVIVAVLDAFVVQGSFGGSGMNTGVLAFLGNLFMLHDYPLFQLLDIAHVDVWWRIRPYQTAEPFWTVAIEFWLYVAMGLFFFVVVAGERVRKPLLIVLAAASVPVLVWNAAAGFGEALSLIWMGGAVAGALVHRLAQREAPVPWGRIAFWVTGFGLLALAGRIKKEGFDPHSLQVALLVGVVMFGVLVALAGRRSTVGRQIAVPVRFFASYSYSLYLIHNTVLVIVFEHTSTWPAGWSIALGVVLGQVAAWLVHLAFERHYRRVALWMRPMFARVLSPSVERVDRVPSAGNDAPLMGAAGPAAVRGATPQYP